MHRRIQDGGWTRQVNVRDFPISTQIAGVNMRLTAGGIRELHWHKADEWALMLNGNCRLTALDFDGRPYVDDVTAGDLWYFPTGVPHSMQGLGPDGCEFLLVFDDGKFSEDDTTLLTDWMIHTPREGWPRTGAWPRKRSIRSTAFRGGPLHFPGAGAAAARAGQAGGDPRRAPGQHRLSVPDDADEAAKIDQGRRGAHRGFHKFSGGGQHRHGAGDAQARRIARAALASERRRMAVLYPRQRAHDRVLQSAPPPARSISAPATSATFRRRLDTMSRIPATPIWSSWKCSRHLVIRTSRSTTG